MSDTLMTGSMWLRRCCIHFQPKKDVHVDSKKDMHVDYSDLLLQIDKRLSDVTG